MSHQEVIPAKKTKSNVTFNKYLTKDHEKSIFESIKDALRSSRPFKHETSSIEFIQDPFPCCVIPNFIEDEDLPLKLKEELMTLEFNDKSNDLYKFKQSDDLKENNLPSVSVFRNIVFSDFQSWLKDITGKTLNETVDMSCAQYHYTDTLLCHDDELDDRSIAFIYYLVPPWSKEDGGALDLFSVGQNGQPSEVSRSILPTFNSFVFFEVTPISFHQVAEVLSKDKCRLSISGWFHGPTPDRPPVTIDPQPLFKPALKVEDEILIEWINPMYLNPEIVCAIQEQFEGDNEILLKDFLLEDKYKTVESELMERGQDWVRQGPPNKRCYDRAENIPSSSTLHELVNFLGSRPLFKLLTKLTGLDLAEIPEELEGDEEEERCSADLDGEKGKNSRSYSEVRRWSHGCYTLMHDEDAEDADYSLDSVLYIGCDDWDPEAGGFTSYVSKVADEELLTIEPCSNCLALTYSDPETMHFVKHVNSRSLMSSTESSSETISCFYDIATIYLE